MSTGSSRSTSKARQRPVPGGKKAVTDELTVATFNSTANGIGGTSSDMHRQLKELEADLKKDMAGKKEYEDYLKLLNMKKQELEKRIADNKKWLATFAAEQDSEATFDMQYKGLVESISSVYKDAKDFHGKGIDMLVKEFEYHPAYKRHSDRFSGIPFTPK